jgi:hypothetical protein
MDAEDSGEPHVYRAAAPAGRTTNASTG